MSGNGLDTEVGRIIISKDKLWCEAYKNGNASKIASLYTEDGQLLPQNSGIISGKDNIESFLKGLIDSGVISDVEIIPSEILDNANNVTEIGAYKMKGPDNKMVDEGKYIVIWKKVGDDLKFYRDMFSSNLPAQ